MRINVQTLQAVLKRAHAFIADYRADLVFNCSAPIDGADVIEHPGDAALVADVDSVLDLIRATANTAAVPDASTLRSDVGYLRRAVEFTGLSTREVAARIGVDSGQLRGYLSGRTTWPYPVQYAIEQLGREDTDLGQAGKQT